MNVLTACLIEIINNLRTKDCLPRHGMLLNLKDVISKLILMTARPPLHSSRSLLEMRYTELRLPWTFLNITVQSYLK